MAIKNYLYNKSVEIVFNDINHTYYLGQEKIPSVTTILSVINKPALVAWSANTAVDYIAQILKPGVSYDEIQLANTFTLAKKAHIQKKTEAGDIGSMVHHWIEDYIKGKNPALPVHFQAQNSIQQFLAWQKEYQVKFLLSEQIIYSKQYNYTGTLDFIAKIGGKLILGDIKTSSGVWDEYWFQLSAYRLARTEEYPQENYQGNGIIRIGKDGVFEWQETNNWQTHAQAFLAAQVLYLTLEQMKEKRAVNFRS